MCHVKHDYQPLVSLVSKVCKVRVAADLNNIIPLQVNNSGIESTESLVIHGELFWRLLLAKPRGVRPFFKFVVWISRSICSLILTPATGNAGLTLGAVSNELGVRHLKLYSKAINISIYVTE